MFSLVIICLIWDYLFFPHLLKIKFVQKSFYGVPWQLVLGEPKTELEPDLRLSEYSTVTRITTSIQWQEERDTTDSSKLCQKENCHSITWGDYFVTHYEDTSSLQFAKYSIYATLYWWQSEIFTFLFIIILVFYMVRESLLYLPLWVDEYSQAQSLPWNCHLSLLLYRHCHLSVWFIYQFYCFHYLLLAGEFSLAAIWLAEMTFHSCYGHQPRWLSRVWLVP